MTIRLKTLRRQEEQTSKVRELMDMYSIKVPNSNYYEQYQPIGASSVIDPRIEKTKDLFQIFHLFR
jgi:hypothetical protein